MIDNYDYMGQFAGNREGVASNFTASLLEWGIPDPKTIVQNRQIGLEGMLKEVGGDFTPLSSPLYYRDPVTGKEGTADNKIALIRSDNGGYLSTVGLRFNPVSHNAAIGGAFGEMASAGYNPARIVMREGGLGIMAQFAAPDPVTIAQRTHVTWHVLIQWLDGRSLIKLGTSLFTPICKNTWRMAEDDLNTGIKHTASANAKLAEYRTNVLQLAQKAEAYTMEVKPLLESSIDSSVVNEFLSAMYPDNKREGVRVNSGPANRRGELGQAIGATMAEVGATVPTFYDLLAGVTRVTSHKASVKADGNVDSFWSYLDGQSLPARAMSWITAR